MSHSQPSYIHSFTLSLLLKPQPSEEPAGDGPFQDSSTAERDFIGFVLSPALHIRDPDVATFFNPSCLELLHSRQSPRARHMEGA